VARQLIPNSTQIPDVILDYWMARLSGAEFKVLLYIARRTYGFGKIRDRISLSQLADGITKRDGSVLDCGTGIARSTVTRALNSLESMGIVVRHANLAKTGNEFNENTYSINLAWEHGGEFGENSFSPSGNGLAADSRGVVALSDYLVAKQERGWSENETGVVPKSDPQETDQQETASTEKGEGDAAAEYQDLVEKLTTNGVGQTVAEELARLHPDVCRRCLEFLPFAKIRSSKGAFLANAIRHGYGPPKGYEDAQKQLARNAAASKKSGGSAAIRLDLPVPLHEREKLEAKFLALQEECPDEFASFIAFETDEKCKVEHIARRLSAKRRSEVLAGWLENDKRLERYERWLQLRNGSVQ
jgi:phage replication O-like protein O